nr:SOS response-associated peptidase family protein [Novosphingobium sp. Gsoil 351]
MTKARDEVARLFGVPLGSIGNTPDEIYPGYPGLVVAADELRSMAWGFPLKLKDARPGAKPRPVNNTRADKLDNFMWRHSFQERRCLIPVSEFAEAEGERGRKTRTWFRLPGQPVFAVAGIWRNTAEWGLVFSMIMTEACIHVADVHDRMPVILQPEDWTDWLDGPPGGAGLLCRPYPGVMAVERTAERWVAPR